MNAQNQLDEWDFQLILIFKRYYSSDILTRVKTL